MIGQTISHYKILEKLGEGGMGVVYKTQDLKLDRVVALKFLSHHLTANEQEKARFFQEAKAASQLNHPNVAIIYEIDEADDEMFIVMEYVDGTTLKTRIRQSAIPIDLVTDLVLQIANGLQAAHEKEIVHRDIKSENIILTREGRIKIMDFGLAKVKGGIGLTRSVGTVGTLSYMSPEQLQARELDARTDLWALGVVLYEALTGRLPFQGEHEAAVMYEIFNVEPLSLKSYRPGVPEHLQELVAHLLQKQPAKRLASAGGVIEWLKHPPKQAQVPSQEKSIAVLYFENMSSEKESDYFCAGITEDIITDLSKIRELKVVSRNDVSPFRGKEVNTRLVGETLRVNYILEGSVRKAGNKIRITAQLIDVRSGFHVWADRFDRLVEDIFDLQNEVSQKIAEALKISLTESEKESLARKPTEDLRAYDFYMRGRELLYRRGKKNNEAAIQMFENALLFDGKFAAAYSALAEAYSYMYAWYDGSPEWLERTIDVSQKALALDPTSVEAQFGLGTVYFHQKRFQEARRMWENAIRQDSDFYDAYRWLGIASDIAGEYDAALGYYEQCVRIKPYSEEPWMHKYMTYSRKGNRAASGQAQRKLLEIGEKKLEINPNDAITLSRMAGPYGHFGEREKALVALKRVLEIDPNDGLAQYNCACSYAVLGDKKEALARLRSAIESGYRNVREWVKSDPDLVTLHEDPEFKTLLAEIG